MNKADLIDTIAQRTGLVRKDVERVLETFEEVVITTLQGGGEVSLTGFVTFMSKRREARMGVNPQHPEERIQIPAVTVPKFKAGKTLKDSLKAQASAAPQQSAAL